MKYKLLGLLIEESVAIVTLNRPEVLNAINTELLEELNSCLDFIVKPESGVRCLLLTGAGRGFCVGGDLAASPESVQSKSGAKSGDEPAGTRDFGLLLERYYNPLLQRLVKLPIPFVTAVNGPAAGAGCSLALAADIVIASKSAYFLQAFVNIGLVPDMGSSWMLPRLVGKARAQAMMMLGEKIPAKTAHEWGMIWQMVEDDALIETAKSTALRLARGPTKTLGLIRNMAHHALESDLSSALQMERDTQCEAGQSNDCTEGIAAFVQKRPAKFTGT